GAQHVAQLPRRFEVAPEGFLDDHPRVLRQPCATELLDHRREHRWWNREVVRRPLAAPEGPAKVVERRGLSVVATHVAEPLEEQDECILVDGSLGSDNAVAR